MARIKITPTKTPPKAKYCMAARRSAPGTGGVKRTRRSRPGTKALREIKKWQKTVELLIRRLPFERLVKETGNNYRTSLLWSPYAIMAIQEAAEAFLVKLLELANKLAIHANRVTIKHKDLELARDIMRI